MGEHTRDKGAVSQNGFIPWICKTKICHRNPSLLFNETVVSYDYLMIFPNFKTTRYIRPNFFTAKAYFWLYRDSSVYNSSTRDFKQLLISYSSLCEIITFFSVVVLIKINIIHSEMLKNCDLRH